MNQISKRINCAIMASGLSYGELSKITGIPKSALQRYATGETEKVPIDRIELIAQATDVKAESIMGWDDKSAQPQKEKPATPEGSGLTPKQQEALDRFKMITDPDLQERALGYLEALAQEKK